ncbi:MAG: rhomboid family intramembrane serine protease [Cytophagales bacterium]|nr:rhomboid family intramembrane serine protease [Armatimonadota bacterium]
MILIPYRAKNPPERFPWITLALIVTNILIYACTSRYFLAVRESALEQFAFSHETLNPWRIFTATFLHADPMHLIGNLLFLWIFGSSVEGRLGPAKFLGLYFFAGFAGALTQDLIVGRGSPALWNLGASGAIMGLAGAYLYLFPYASICVVFILPILVFFRVRVMEWQARWVVLWFLGFDVLYGALFQGRDGVAHFWHLGGAVAGFMLVLALRAPRDEEEFSEAQRMRADSGGDYQSLALHELTALLEGKTNTENVPLILAYCWKAQRLPEGDGHRLCLEVLQQKERLLVAQADPLSLATIALAIPASVGQMSSMFLLRLGSRLEAEQNDGLAMRAYRQLITQEPEGRDTEMALSRLARLTLRGSGGSGEAAAIYQEQLRRFPQGALALDARTALGRIPAPTVVYSAGQEAGAAAATLPVQSVAALSPPIVGIGTDTLPETAVPVYRAHPVNSASGISLRPIGEDTAEKIATAP